MILILRCTLGTCLWWWGGNKFHTNHYTDFVETTAPFDLVMSVVDMVMITSKTGRLID